MIKFVRSALNRAGFDVIRTKNQHDGLAWHLRNVFKSKGIDCVLDVGANAGQYGLFLRSLGFSGYIVSFEPVKSVFKRLEETAARDAKWLCYNAALGDESGERTINVYESTVFSSFLDASEYAKNVWKSLNSVASEVVRVTRLDDIFSEVAARTSASRFYLKMDTQGFDRNVFNGALNSLTHVHALQSELSLIPVYDRMPDTYRLLQEFNANGFFISGMYPVNRDSSMAVIEYDCVLVKKTAEQ